MIIVRRIVPGLTAIMPRWPIVICGICLALPLARLAAWLSAARLRLVQPPRRTPDRCIHGGLAGLGLLS